MTHRFKAFLQSLIIPAAFAGAALAPGSANALPACVAGDACAGYDLFHTVTPGTSFQGIEFQGVPLGTFDFGPSGGPAGPTDVGNTDTIIQRLDTVSPPSGTTPLSVLALQLVSTVPVNGHLIYVTLDEAAQQTFEAANGGAGSMTINITDPNGTTTFPTSAGTFSSSFTINFDLTLDSPSGTNVNTDFGCSPAVCRDTLVASDVDWFRTPPITGALQIQGVNYLLDGRNTGGDFWPAAHLVEIIPDLGQHVVDPALPEPGTLALLGSALFGFWGLYRRKSRHAV